MVADGIDGKVIAAGDVDGLRGAIRSLAQDRGTAEALGRAGYVRLCRDNSEDIHYEALVATYEAAIAAAR